VPKCGLPILLLLLSLFLAACGGGNSGEEAQIEATIREVVLSDDPAKCSELLTETALEQASDEGKAPLRECEEEVEDTNDQDADAVSVGNVEVEGSTATAEVAVVGGSYDSQVLVFSLLEDEGQWRLDKQLRFAEFHKAALIKGLERSLDEDEEGSPRQRRCVVDSLNQASRGRIEALVLSKSDAIAIALLRECPEHEFQGTDEQKVERTIGKLFSGRDPALCVEVVTARYLEESLHSSGLSPLQGCFAAVQARLHLTNIVRVTEIEVDGSRATGNAEILTEGLGLKGQILTLALVEDRGHWKADRLLGFARLDRSALTDGIVSGLEAIKVAVTKRMKKCLLLAIDRLSQAQVEALLTDPSRTRSRRLLGHCIGEAPLEQPRAF
jgi:hypothetical protein